MSDLDELKRLAQAAQVNRDLIEGLHWQMATNPLAVLALIERVEEAERRADLRQNLLDAEKAERDALRARLAVLEDGE